MSDLIVRVVTIDEVRPHPNADKLEIVKVGGWQIVSGKGNYVAGQTAIHVPPDAMVPKEWADTWGVTQYLSWKKDATKGRVKAVKLRGAPSYGFLAPVLHADECLGDNVAERLGIEKYEEPERPGMQAGQMARNHPLFHTYTDIQNLRNFPDAIHYDRPIIITEKLHGTNSRVGWVSSMDPESGGIYLEKVAGTHRTQRKMEESGTYGLPWQLYDKKLNALFDIIVGTSVPGVCSSEQLESLIIFGEIFGPGVQDLTYGKEKAWRVFDIAVNGMYLPWYYVRDVCKEVGLPIVPHMNPAIYTFEELCELAEGESVLSPGQIKEGIVVRPMGEETWKEGDLDPHPRRSIFKIISSEYLTRKGGTENH